MTGVVCGNCGKGDWQDYEHGDWIDKCPFCERQGVTLVDPEDYEEDGSPPYGR